MVAWKCYEHDIKGSNSIHLRCRDKYKEAFLLRSKQHHQHREVSSIQTSISSHTIALDRQSLLDLIKSNTSAFNMLFKNLLVVVASASFAVALPGYSSELPKTSSGYEAVPPPKTSSAYVPPPKTSSAYVPPPKTSSAYVPPPKSSSAYVPPPPKTSSVPPPVKETTICTPCTSFNTPYHGPKLTAF
jgi:hypothetical protein